MKAIVLRELGGPNQLRYEDVEVPTPKANEVLVRLKYAALNRRDMFITYGMYPGMKLPSILGTDGSGEVAAVGGQVSDIRVGSAVVINPALNWGDNRAYHGPDQRLVGMPTDGTYAEYIVVPAENVFTKPDYLSWEEAAALPVAGVTAFRALMYRGNLKKGENVLIPGIGSGVALVALQIAVAHGANVFVTSSSDEKLEKAKQLGAKGGVNYRSDQWVKELKKLMGGADLIIDGVGGENFNHMISIANPAGRIVNFGATSGPIKDLILPRVFFKHLDIKGSTMGSPEDFREMLQFFEEHQIPPYIDKCYPLEAATEAQIYMEKGENFGKITLEIE
ncbi:zinc-binding dehydrogenase [Anaerobacillus isosaccharinicus]|uniref:Alcohol dehydrogenase n=1 Tax=Anaerobacillus isosaccharinicus TaxID=1532552 RepID=A0A1S2L546_9BACI|nr:zinc-binding dehydrogenase [Anaerobacillus isosaccharinicus]MBA5586373.1 zinc-binding dehydrogenase [Anaerobacillus isosaccharinicus]QOY35381.1 zinc-binding dehydrogenase [Anaerobacillus isosaccharinicus]